jgi:WD40 repeat protein
LGSVAFLERNTIVAADGPQRVRAWTLYPVWSLESTIGTGDANSPLSDRVNAVRFSPDGQVLATGGGEPTRSGEIKLWNVADGAFLRAFTNVHSDAIFSLDYSPDGKYLASSSADRFVRVLDLATGKIVRAFEGHTSYVLGVAWKADSRTLASAGADNVIKIWDFTTGDRKKNIDGATKEITSIAFVGITDQTLATSGDNQVRLVKENGEKIRAFDGPADFMNAAAATPDGTLVVAGGQDGQLRVWNGTDGKLMANFGPSTP